MGVAEAQESRTDEKDDPGTGRRGDAGSLEGAFSALESKIRSLAARVGELGAENGRLRGALGETVAERDRARTEASDLREAAGRSSAEAEQRLAGLESEREEIRLRIERLLAALEEDASPASP